MCIKKMYVKCSSLNSHPLTELPYFFGVLGGVRVGTISLHETFSSSTCLFFVSFRFVYIQRFTIDFRLKLS